MIWDRAGEGGSELFVVLSDARRQPLKGRSL
jgi:hypothetical protein